MYDAQKFKIIRRGPGLYWNVETGELLNGKNIPQNKDRLKADNLLVIYGTKTSRGPVPRAIGPGS